MAAVSIRVLLAAAVLLAGAPAVASAAETSITGFQTPSKTTACAVTVFEDVVSLRCDVSQATTETPRKPESCEYDYGFAFGMAPTGRSRRLCVSDTPFDPSFEVLAYGERYKRRGFTCGLTRVRLRCVNRSGRGWELSRGRQRLL